MTRYATPEDFARWEEHAETMNASALIYSAKDARAAAAALDSHDPVAAGRYTDEAMTYERELRRRREYRPPEHPINRVPVNGREPRVPQAIDAYQRANSCAARAIEHRRAGYAAAASESNANARFWRTVALGHLNAV